MPTKLTHELLRDQVPPTQGAITIWDDPPKGKGAPGFGVRIYSGGTKSFFLNYRFNGIERRYTIGCWPLWSIEAAREEARARKRDVDAGSDPAIQRRERRDAPTVQELVERYKRDHLPNKTAGEHRAKDERKMLDLVAEQLGKHTKVTEIHDGDIGKMHRALTEARGPVRANRILALTSKMFALSLQSMAGENSPWRNAVMGNPCKGVPRNHEDGRERFYSADELGRISDALASYGEEARGPGKASAKTAADCVRLIMLTGCRPTEARRATWDQFDTESGFWVKPSAHTKQRKVHKVPLNPPTTELVERMRRRRVKDAQWVFPGQCAGEPLKQLWSVWGWVREKAELGEGARLYDLRHTFASIGVSEGGLNLPIISRLLGHTQARTTQRYAHLADDPLKEATKKIGNFISPPSAEAATAEVVSYHKAV